MTDLIYDEEVKPLISKRFPHAKYTDASDEVHEGRFQVELPDSDRDDFYKAAIREGWHGVSLHFQLMMNCGRKESAEQIMKWIDEIKAEKVDCA